LHRGSLAAALASWLDARSHQGKWLIRIENVDTPRERSGAAEEQLRQLRNFGLVADEPLLMQSDRFDAYESALQRLRKAGLTYVCRCTRARLGARAGAKAGASAAIYPGTCRGRKLSLPGAVRVIATEDDIEFVDRASGAFGQNVARDVGDFIVRRSDGLWSYQLAVVVDDAAQGITDVVRGADLLDNTPRQIQLQRALQLPTPRYLHIPLVLGADGRKLSKQDGAAPLGGSGALAQLEQAWAHLGFAPSGASSVARFHDHAIAAWGSRFGAAPAGAIDSSRAP
jgi:glutamyl-Q tRNA(Asp) synthetase